MKSFRIQGALVLVLTLPAACKEEADKPADPAPAAEAPAAQAPAAAAPVAAPAMMDQVGEVSLPKVDPPSSWQAGWQLEPGKNASYAYHQIMKMGGGANGGPNQHMDVTGTLLIQPTAPDAADVELTNVKGVMTMKPPGMEEQKMEQDLGTKRYAGLLKTGAAAVDQPEDPLVWAILSVPREPTPVGKPVTQPLSMPVDAPEGTLTAEGEATWTLQGFVKCGEHTCAHYSHDVDINKLSAPPGVRGTYSARAKATGWTLFDVDDRALFQHKSATHLRLAADIPPPPQPEGAASQPAEPATMDMTQEHFHEVTRQ